MPFLDRPDARLHYERWEPEGTPRGHATLLNGHTRTAQDLRMMGRALTALGFDVVAPDQRGAGETESRRDFTLDDMALDVVALWDALGWKQSDVVGLSMGGMVALTLALRPEANDRLRRLVLVSTTAARHDVTPYKTPRSAEEIEASLLENFSPNFIEKQRFLLKAFVKEMARAFEDPRRLAGANAQRRAMQGFDVTKRLGEIAVPTAVIHGDRDMLINASLGEAMARAMPDATVRIVPDVGHLLLAEAPRRLYDLVTEFLNETEFSKEER